MRLCGTPLRDAVIVTTLAILPLVLAIESGMTAAMDALLVLLAIFAAEVWWMAEG